MILQSQNKYVYFCQFTLLLMFACLLITFKNSAYSIENLFSFSDWCSIVKCICEKINLVCHTRRLYLLFRRTQRTFSTLSVCVNNYFSSFVTFPFNVYVLIIYATSTYDENTICICTYNNTDSIIYQSKTSFYWVRLLIIWIIRIYENLVAFCYIFKPNENHWIIDAMKLYTPTNTRI